jgi:hypothetical protein
MIPLYGLEVYRELLRVNAWARRFLPNAFAEPQDPSTALVSPLCRALKRGAEFALRGRLGDAWENSERRRKIDPLRQEAAQCGTDAAAYTPECCKGHLHDHGRHIGDEYARRLRQIGLDVGSSGTLSAGERA